MRTSVTVKSELVIRDLLQKYFVDLKRQNVEVKQQWHTKIKDAYSPTIDIAVGPFAEIRQFITEYNELTQISKGIIEKLSMNFKDNLRILKGSSHHEFQDIDLQYNPNARCFLAIEIEKSGSRKHRLGDIVNVSALGRIGIIAAWDNLVLKSFLKIMEYFSFLQDVQKPSFKSRNVVIITKEQLENTLEEAIKD